MIIRQEARAFREVHRLLDQRGDIGSVSIAGRRRDRLVDIGRRHVAYPLGSDARQDQPVRAVLVILDRCGRELRLVDLVDHCAPNLAEARLARPRIDGQVLASASAYEDLLRSLASGGECRLRDRIERHAAALPLDAEVDHIGDRALGRAYGKADHDIVP